MGAMRPWTLDPPLVFWVFGYLGSVPRKSYSSADQGASGSLACFPSFAGPTAHIQSQMLSLDAQGDDFLVPSDVDLNDSCDSNTDILSNKIILPLGGCLSVLCYLYLLWMYYVVKSPVLMRHPTSKPPSLPLFPPTAPVSDPFGLF